MADTTTPKYLLTDLVEGQGGAPARVNTNNRIHEAMTNLVIADRDLTAPPGGGADGVCYIVATGGTGAFSGEDGNIAIYSSSGSYSFRAPFEGLTARILDENIRVEYDGSNWQRIPTSAKPKQIMVRIDSPSINDQIPILFTPGAITISSVRAVIFGSSSPGIDYNIMHNSSRAAAGTQVFTADKTVTSTTSGNVASSGFNDNTIAASRFVWAEIESAPTGTVDAVEFYIEYTEDAP